MSSVETLLSEYIQEHRTGGLADPIGYVNRAAPSDRLELAALIDAYLMRAPRTPLAEQPRQDQRSEATIDALARSIGGEAGMWPALLPRLRHQAGLKRREVIEQLSATLGVSNQAKVERYYHDMELGQLPAAGVSDAVLRALSELFGTTTNELRDAGTRIGGRSPGGSPAVAFTRLASAEGHSTSARASVDGSPSEDGWDKVDELFRGSS